MTPQEIERGMAQRPLISADEAQRIVDAARALRDPQTIESVLAELVPAPSGWPCRGKSCSAVLDRPGICAFCVASAERDEKRARVATQIRREIPGRFAWAKWGAPLLPQRVRGGIGMVAHAQEKLTGGGRVTLAGAAGTGRTSLACAWLREQIESGREQRDRFVAAHDLAAPSHVDGVTRFDLAISADALVIDDLGEELFAAPAGGGVAAQRIEIMSKLIRTRYDRDLDTVITTGRDAATIARLYGDGIARRVFESTVVRL